MANTVRIANPVFDSFFKLLVQDLRAAKFLNGTIIRQEVIDRVKNVL
jgi:hypothetical protein